MDRDRENTEPCYVISVAARILGIQTHNLRYYEKIGIIEPHRSQGNIRLYSARDISILQRVKTMVDGMGINLAGVEVVLRMMKHVSELQNELEQTREELNKLQKGK